MHMVLKFNSLIEVVPRIDGLKCLLVFGGWQYVIARWGQERGMFYTEHGDYIEDAPEKVFWAELRMFYN